MATRRRPLHTRRQVLTTGVLGLAGMGKPSISSGRPDPDGASTASPVSVPRSGAFPVLQPGAAEEAGMSAARLRRISGRLREETSEGGVGSASILVARHGKVVLHRGFGKLNRLPGAPATRPDTLYMVASISKPVSVCGLMLLVEEGRVVLADRVQRYLPEFQGRLKERVLVGHLLSHTSGLPDMVPENTRLRRSHAPLSQFVAAALRTPLLFEPGTRFSYQSMGTLLAAEIAERVSGMRLRDLLGTRIFRPLGMRRTMLGLEGLKVEETAIFQEDRDSEDSRGWGPNSPYWRAMGHPWGGLHATTGDLAALLQTFLNGGRYGEVRVFSPATVAAMTRDRNGHLGAPWGYGWALRDSPVWNYFGDLATAGAFGHVGISGTVAWADPGRQLICVLLSTRTAAHQDGFLLKSISNMVQAAVLQR